MRCVRWSHGFLFGAVSHPVASTTKEVLLGWLAAPPFLLSVFLSLIRPS